MDHEKLNYIWIYINHEYLESKSNRRFNQQWYGSLKGNGYAQKVFACGKKSLTGQREDYGKVILFMASNLHVFLHSCSFWYPPTKPLGLAT